MKRITMCVAAALVAALAAGTMAGCGSQPAASASGSGSASASSASGSASASAVAEQSQDEIIAELKGALKNVPKFKSVTVTEDSISTLSNVADATETSSSEAASSSSAAAEEAGAESDSIAARTVYKFDESGDTVRTSMTGEIEDITLQYFTEGDNAVCVTDGPVYSGTVEQFDLPHAAGSKAYLSSATGDLDTIVECIATATKSQQDGMTVYELTLDPAKRIASDEVFQILADNGDPILSESVIVGFDEKGYLVWANEKREFQDTTAEKNLMLSDFDSTVVDPMPEADKTYEEMEADIDEKYEALFAEWEAAESAEGAVSSEAAEVK